MNIGLIGFGNVGQAIFDMVELSFTSCRVAKIGVKDISKARTISAHYFTDNINSVLDSPGIDIVIEVTSDSSAAFGFLKHSLKNKKPFITANKKMVAEYHSEIVSLQRQYKTPVLYEAAVCGAIPILRTIEDFYCREKISEIEGIVNGTTNYILTQIFDTRKSYQEALLNAQIAGFAEPDPFLDISGWDAKCKLSIMIAHAHGLFVHPENIIGFGIDRISDQDIQFAKKHGMIIKLVASAYRCGNSVYGIVAPKFIDNDSLFAAVKNENNVVAINAEYSSRQYYIGKGAGSYPTSSAIAYDLSALLTGYRYAYAKVPLSRINSYSKKASLKVYVSASTPDGISFSDFISVSEGYSGTSGQYMVGEMSLETIDGLRERGDVSLVVLNQGKITTLSVSSSDYHRSKNQTGRNLKQSVFSKEIDVSSA
jgi:homoserine dehydrogenase